jgi:putative transposase
MRESFHISELCEALGASASGYHAARQRPPSRRQNHNEQLIQQMKSIHSHRHTRSYGSPKMTRELRNHGWSCSENRVARLMRREGLRSQPRRPFRPRTTQPDHAAHPSLNLLAEAGPAAAPGTHLVSDITYIPTREGWLYLAVVIDLLTRLRLRPAGSTSCCLSRCARLSRAILGWKLSESLHTEVVTDALRRAWDTGLMRAHAIFHSDRGCQYTATHTRQLLARHGLRQSMSAKGYCYDNAFAESAFASLKSELLDDGQPFDSKAAASTAVFDYLESFYNRTRLHSSLGYLSPHAFLNHYFQTQNSSLN